ncbi:MAG: DUF3108 domain-containing protein [Rhodoferax sp.]|nr:DUF3108 domain-containing protein [Rhodoferax sp.]MCF8209337.1 DUF3108 domain-containing protein [Rhodoferax sp.]
MPHPTRASTCNGSPCRRALALLTLCVLLGHAAVLQGAPMSLGFSPTEAAVAQRPFQTRSIGLMAAPEVLATEIQAPIPLPLQQGKRAVKALPPDAVPRANSKGFGHGAAAASSMDTVTDAVQTSSALELLASRASAVPVAAASELESMQVAAVAQALPVPSALPPATVTNARAQGTPPGAVAIPAPVRLLYDINGEIKGFPYIVKGDLSWQHDQKTYEARLEISHFLLGSRVQTSKGALSAQGLAPLRFGDKVRSEVAAHFERSKGKVSFSANTPDAALQPGAQDQLSVFIQMAALLGGDPAQFRAGSRLSFQAVGPRSSDEWVFEVGATETLDLPGGSVAAVKLMRSPTSEFDSRGEIWFAPGMDYMPVRIRLTQANGDFADQLWKSTEKPRSTP